MDYLHDLIGHVDSIVHMYMDLELAFRLGIRLPAKVLHERLVGFCDLKWIECKTPLQQDQYMCQMLLTRHAKYMYQTCPTALRYLNVMYGSIVDYTYGLNKKETKWVLQQPDISYEGFTKLIQHVIRSGWTKMFDKYVHNVRDINPIIEYIKTYNKENMYMILTNRNLISEDVLWNDIPWFIEQEMTDVLDRIINSNLTIPCEHLLAPEIMKNVEMAETYVPLLVNKSDLFMHNFVELCRKHHVRQDHFELLMLGRK